MRHLAASASGRSERGFTLFELAISAIIVAILLGLLLQRLHTYREQSERAAVEQLVAVLRSALTLKTAELTVRNRTEELSAYAQQNPMLWLVKPPPNYLGEFFAPDIRDVQAGNWYFDRKTKTLVYLLNEIKTFPGAARKSLKFKVKSSKLLPNNASHSALLPSYNFSLEQVDG